MVKSYWPTLETNFIFIIQQKKLITSLKLGFWKYMFSILHHKFTGFHVLVTSPAIFFGSLRRIAKSVKRKKAPWCPCAVWKPTCRSTSCGASPTPGKSETNFGSFSKKMLEIVADTKGFLRVYIYIQCIYIYNYIYISIYIYYIILYIYIICCIYTPGWECHARSTWRNTH